MPWQRNRAIAPFADRFGPLIRPPLEPVPDRAARIGAGEHGHDRGYAQFGQLIRMRGVIGRQVDREAGIDGRNDQAPVLDNDRVVAEDGLVGEGDDVFAGVGGDDLFEARTVDLRPISGQVASLSVSPQPARA
jgi:hypothetical protein